MSVTTSTYTANSKKITIVNETSSTFIIQQIDACMAAVGWTLWDTVAVTTFSPIVTKVYRAINADTITYKYMIFRINTQQLVINTSACEGWDQVTTHLPTNETWNGAMAFQQGYDLKDCVLVIGGTTRHCLFWNFIKGEGGMWTCVLEFERVAGEDTASANVPCFAWTSSLMIGTPWGTSLSTSTSQTMFAFPRTADGQTGASAARIYAPTTNRGMYPPNYPSIGNSTYQIAPTLDVNLLHLGSYYNMTYGWDATKTVVSPIAADSQFKSMPVGRAYNTGVTKSLGTFLDSTLVPGDVTGGWPSASGTSTEYLLLPMNGGCELDTAYLTGRATITYGQTAAAIVGKPIAVGSTVYLPSHDGIRTYDMNTGQGGGTTQRYVNANGVYDIVFDGQRSIYGSTSNGIVKVDTETFTATVLTSITTGTSYLALDQKYIYASGRTAQLIPQVFMVQLNNFNSASTVTSFTITTGTTVATGFGTPVPDYLGNCYVATQAATNSAQTMRIANFTADTGVQIQGNVNPKVTGSTTAGADSPTSFWIDYSSGRIYLVVGFATNGSIYELNNQLLTLQQNGTFTTGATGVVCQASMATTSTTYDFRGDMAIVPVRGQFLIFPKKVGQAAATGYAARIQFNLPGQTTPGLTFGIGASTTATTGYPLGFAAGASSNGVRLFTTWSQVSATDNRTNYINTMYNTTAIGGYQTGRMLIKA
jgi:hypothetical protein